MTVSRSDRVDAGGADRAERRSVLDEALLLAVPPDEVRDLVDVAVGAGRDRREADRRQRRERRRGARVRPVLEQEADRRRVGGLEHRRRQAVDHDQDDRLRPSSVAGERAEPGVAVGCAAAQAQRRAAAPRAPRGSRAPARTRARHRRARRARAVRPVPPRCRRAAARRRRAAPSRTRRRLRRRARRAASSHCQNAKPTATATAAATTAPGAAAAAHPTAATPKRRAEAGEDSDRVPGPHRPASVGSLVRLAAGRSRRA